MDLRNFISNFTTAPGQISPNRIASGSQPDETNLWGSPTNRVTSGEQRMAINTFPYEQTILIAENLMITTSSTNAHTEEKYTYPVEILQEFLILTKEFGSYFRQTDYLYAEGIYKYGGTISTLCEEIKKYEETKGNLPQLTQTQWQKLSSYIGVLTLKEDIFGQLQFYKKIPRKAMEADIPNFADPNSDDLSPENENLNHFIESFDQVLKSYQKDLR